MVEIKNILVLGTGLMGNGIGQVCLMAGYNVTLVDIAEDALTKAWDDIAGGLKKLEAKGKLGEGITADAVMGRCKKSTDLASAVKDIDMVIEAVVENMNVKKQVSKTTMDNGPAHIIFASNTSTMSIEDIGKDCGKPAQVCGIHFFNPVMLMAAIEVIKSANTSDETFDSAIAVAKKLPVLRGKRYIASVLKDRPGFIVNRLNAPSNIYLNYVFDKAAEKGIPWGQIDADGGSLMPMGPCELSDYVGLDTLHHVMEYNEKMLSPEFKPGKVLSEMVAKGTLGRKTGQGFYNWKENLTDKKRPTIDKSQKAGMFDLELTMAIMLNEGCRILEEGVAKGFSVIDKANMAGMNVPGPFGAGKKQYEKWIGLLDKFVEESGIQYFKPCELMKSGGFVKMR